MKRIRLSSFTYKMFLSCFISFFFYFFIFSEFGLIRHYATSLEFQARVREICAFKREVAQLEQEIVKWKKDPFYVEKMAREELGMGYQDEIVYLYKS